MTVLANFSTDSMQLPSKSNSILYGNGKADPKVHMEMQETQNSQTILKNKIKVQSWKTHTF